MSSAINSYLTFIIGENIFGVNVAKILEIIEYGAPKHLPQTLPFVTGLIEYRDEVIPLIDSSLKFGMKPLEIKPSTCTIVLQLTNGQLGSTYRVAIMADAVSDVIEPGEEKIKSISSDYSPGYITGSYLTDNNRFVYILDVDKIFNQMEVIAMMDILKSIK